MQAQAVMTKSKQLIEELETRVAKLTEAMADKWDKPNNIITFDEMSAAAAGVTMQFSEGIEGQRIDGVNSLSFYTIFLAGKIMEIHGHNCFERIKVEYGKIINHTTGQVVKMGEYLIIPPFSMHRIGALDPSAIRVDFSLIPFT